MNILLNIGLVRRIGKEDNESVLDLLSGAEQSVTRASALTRQLLLFAKGSVTAIEIHDIRPIIKASAGFAVNNTEARIVYRFVQNLWPAEVDVGQISQVIYNLVQNAVQALPQGGTIEIVGENITSAKTRVALKRERTYSSRLSIPGSESEKKTSRNFRSLFYDQAERHGPRSHIGSFDFKEAQGIHRSIFERKRGHHMHDLPAGGR